MKIVTGKSILEQIAYGRLRFYRRAAPELVQYSGLSYEEELDRLLEAKARMSLTLASFYDRTRQEVGAKIAGIFTVHSLLMEDEGLIQNVRSLMREQHFTPEYAVWTTGQSVAASFRSMPDPYMQARAADIWDISRRLVRILLGSPPQDPLREGSAILVADEFLPSEVLDLDRRKLLGLISREGSVDSHTALLLHAYHIPAMAEVRLDPIWDGRLAMMDGFAGRLYLEPGQDVLESLRIRYEEGGKPADVVRANFTPA